MHRHGYKGRKFGRERGKRLALIKSLADSLVIKESIETTEIKAKEIRPYVERLITKAKKGDLHSRRQVINGLLTLEAAHKLVDSIVPKLKSRVSGHLRIVRTRVRRGDNAQLAKISFVDELNELKTTEVSSDDKPKKKVKSAKKTTTKKVAKK